MTASPTADSVRPHRRFHRHGSPTVVFVAGLGDTGDTWHTVQDRVSPWASTLSYDRAGVGRNPAVTGVRSCGDLVDELAGLLGELDAPTPWLLVGHSFGGLVARLFAARHPHAVAGLVLVDAVVELRELAYEPVLPAALRAANRAYLEDPAGNAERIDKLASYRQVAAHPLPDGIALSVITRGRPDDGETGWPARRILEVDQRMQRDLARRSPAARHRIAARSGHDVQHDQPEIVLEEIMTMLKGIRR